MRSYYSVMLLPLVIACSSSTTTVHSAASDGGQTNATASGGDSSNVNSGGLAASGGTVAVVGGAPNGGTAAVFGGAPTTGGLGATGGSAGISQSSPTGGAATGGENSSVPPTGGNAAQGGTAATPTGGASTVVPATGGVISGTGGAATGGLGTVCTAGAAKCGGGETETTALKCSTDQNGYTVTAYCSDTNTQCNPATGTCFALGIDPTEVTRAQYAAFVSAGGVTQVPGCATFNTSFAPDATCMANAAVCQGAACDSQPQVCVDWCDAYAYCDKLGKRLCGRIGGGMNPFDRAADPGSSQWMNACSAGGQYKYGSGARVDSGPAFCNYVGTQLGTTYAVGTHAGCTSPSPTYNTIFDLSGNVAEWEDSCEKPIDTVNLISGADACRTRGGSFNSPLAALSCDAVPAIAQRRDAVAPDVGFRCCSK